uniref:Uncharacterized protein n=1 Tax=Anguilla anguilla TaxID=7936 RepID=A0A0E9WDR0_ANGAN
MSPAQTPQKTAESSPTVSSIRTVPTVTWAMFEYFFLKLQFTYSLTLQTCYHGREESLIRNQIC